MLQRAPQDANVWFAQGELARSSRDLDGALVAFNHVLETNPCDLDSRLGCAEALVNLNRDDEAFSDLTAIWSTREQDPQANYLYALILTKIGDADKAQKVLEKAALGLMSFRSEYVRRHPPSLLLMGILHFRNQHYDEAFPLLDRYVQLDPGNAAARKLLAAIMLMRDLPAGAVDILVPALKNGAQDIELLTLLGQAYAQNNQPEFAARLSQQMESVGAGDETLRTQRALTSLAMRGKPNDDPEQAESDLDLGTGEGGAGVLLGVLQLRKGDPKAVLKTVRVLRDQRPNSASVQNLVGAIELVAGEVEASRASFARALAADSTFRPVLRNLARADARAGSFTAAVQRLEQLVAQDATDLRAMSELAAIAERQGQFAKAVDWLKRVRQQNPAAIAPQLRLLDVCIKDRRLADAGQLVDELAVAFPTSIHVRIARGRVQLAAGDRGRATATFRELSAQEESSSDRSLRLVKFQLATNDVDGARETLLRIESRDPGLLPAQESLLALELREGKAKEALARVVQLRERHPDAAIVDRLHGDVLMHSVDFAAAAAAYRKAHATDQTETYAIALFTALHRSGDLDGAIRFLQGWVNSGNSGLTPAHKALAAGLLALERNDQARQVFQNLQALGADDPLVLAGLARMKIRSGDMASAKAHAERAYAVAPTDVAALDAMGWLLVHSDDSSAGLRLLREAHDRDSTAQRVRYHIAVALHQLGRKAEARRELDHVLSDSRPFDGRIDAQALLERL